MRDSRPGKCGDRDRTLVTGDTTTPAAAGSGTGGGTTGDVALGMGEREVGENASMSMDDAPLRTARRISARWAFTAVIVPNTGSSTASWWRRLRFRFGSRPTGTLRDGKAGGGAAALVDRRVRRPTLVSALETAGDWREGSSKSSSAWMSSSMCTWCVHKT